MTRLELISILCLGLSSCANLIFLGIVSPRLEMLKRDNENDSLEIMHEVLYEIYRVNKPALLKKHFLADFYVIYGGVLCYLIFVLLSTIAVFEITQSISQTAIYTIFVSIAYKLLISMFKIISNWIGKYTIVLSFVFVVSFILTILILYNLLGVLSIPIL